MSSSSTLNSRLRVLVAKAFRAEKLYSSMGRTSTTSPSAGLAGNLAGDRLSNMAVLAEAASEIRAKEWQRTHYQLRIALNDILAVGNTSKMLSQLTELRDNFLTRARENSVLLEKGSEELIETAKRQEFAHIFKISLELIRTKAQTQASHVIVEELSAVLDGSAVNVGAANVGAVNVSSKISSSVRTDDSKEIEKSNNTAQHDPSDVATKSNVIHLPRRFASGR